MMRALSPARLLRALLRAQRGTSTIELALVLPVLGVLSLGAIDFAMAFGMKLQVQQYAQSGADFVVASGASVPTTDAVKAEVATVSGLAPTKITVTKFTECNQVKVVIFNLCPGASDTKISYMTIEVQDTYTPMLNIEGFADFVSTTTLKGRTTVRLA